MWTPSNHAKATSMSYYIGRILNGSGGKKNSGSRRVTEIPDIFTYYHIGGNATTISLVFRMSSGLDIMIRWKSREWYSSILMRFSLPLF